jgi:hypothetical protein
MGIRTDLLVTEEIAESSDLRATPFEFERAKRVEAALSILEGKWKIVVLNRLHILHVDTTFLFTTHSIRARRYRSNAYPVTDAQYFVRRPAAGV